MWPDRVSNLGPLTYESGALPTALRGPAALMKNVGIVQANFFFQNQERALACQNMANVQCTFTHQSKTLYQVSKE